MSFSFNLKLFSKNRAGLMGLATILILMTHAPAYGVFLPFGLNSLLSAGQIGVLVFFFISGMGLYFSLDSKRDLPICEIISWYKKRFVRLLVPYLIIFGGAHIIVCVENQWNIFRYFFDLSTISFWFGHSTCWFVDVLVPLYIISPFWYKLLSRFKYNIIPTIIAASLLIATGNGYMIQASVFFVGFWLARYIKDEYVIHSKELLTIIALVCIALALYYILGIGYLLLILLPPFLLVCCYMLDTVKNTLVHQILNFFGEISLESYLFNTTLIIWIQFFGLLPDYMYNYRYVYIVVFGTLLSYLVHRLCKPLIAKLS